MWEGYIGVCASSALEMLRKCLSRRVEHFRHVSRTSHGITLELCQVVEYAKESTSNKFGQDLGPFGESGI
jgi:hypothetical protein